MRIEIVATGDELVGGRVQEGNSFWLLGRLAAAGAPGTRVTVVGDDPSEIEAALREVSSRSDLVVVSGGLGPTEDDRSAECAARVAGVALVEDTATRERISARWKARGGTPPDRVYRQARVPSGAEVLGNDEGTAPAFLVRLGRAQCLFVPGVPREFRHVCERHVLPRVAGAGGLVRLSRTLRCLWIPESELEAALEDLARDLGLELGLRAAYPETWATFSGSDDDRDSLLRRLTRAVRIATERLGPRCFDTGGRTLAEVVAQSALERSARLAVAESCTGGLIGAELTSVPGSSAFFVGGAITYANEEKVRALGVPSSIIAAHGAVSEPVALAMAEGLRQRLGATHCVSVTGIAGPGGGSAGKPVGTVWIALATARGTTAELHHFRDFGRQSIRRAATAAALDLARRALQEAG